jgi:hypothetical protein
MPASDREDGKLYLTIFILWGVESLYMTLFSEEGGRAQLPRHASALTTQLLPRFQARPPFRSSSPLGICHLC